MRNYRYRGIAPTLNSPSPLLPSINPTAIEANSKLLRSLTTFDINYRFTESYTPAFRSLSLSLSLSPLAPHPLRTRLRTVPYITTTSKLSNRVCPGRNIICLILAAAYRQRANLRLRCNDNSVPAPGEEREGGIAGRSASANSIRWLPLVVSRVDPSIPPIYTSARVCSSRDTANSEIIHRADQRWNRQTRMVDRERKRATGRGRGDGERGCRKETYFWWFRVRPRLAMINHRRSN